MSLVVYVEAAGLDLKPIEADLASAGLTADFRGPVLAPSASHDWKEWLAWHLAAAKVRSADARVSRDHEPATLEVEREGAALAGRGRPPGPLYDGAQLVGAWHGALPAAEQPFGPGPIVVLTDRLLGTFEGSRYHVRFLVTGHPCVVSVPGFFEGPARDRSYYLAREMVGLDASLVATDDHLRRDDPRLAMCIASALLQVASYYRTGEPFCADPSCRLFNPHWQREMLASMAATRLCPRHHALVRPPSP